MNTNSGDTYKLKYYKYKNKYINLKKIKLSQNKTDLVEKPELILFKAEWCGHCRSFKQTWNALETHLTNVNFRTIDADKDEDELKKFNVEGFPTLMLKNKKGIIEFNGDRSVDNIITFVNENIN